MSGLAVESAPSVELQVAVDVSSVPPETDWARWVATARAMSARDAPGSVTIRLVGEDEGADLNFAFRDKPGPTNVLAFPGPALAMPGETPELGDVVICLPVALHEAHAQGKTPPAHLAHLAVHGTLHLLGFDHVDEAQAEQMEALEIRIMQRLGFPDPYSPTRND